MAWRTYFWMFLFSLSRFNENIHIGGIDLPPMLQFIAFLGDAADYLLESERTSSKERRTPISAQAITTKIMHMAKFKSMEL